MLPTGFFKKNITDLAKQLEKAMSYNVSVCMVTVTDKSHIFLKNSWLLWVLKSCTIPIPTRMIRLNIITCPKSDLKVT